jgi:hypothetical protein
MQIINLSRENQDPIDGDKIRIIHGNGFTEEKQYTAPGETPAPTRRQVVIARLLEIDDITDRPRTRRELQLNKAGTKAWLKDLDDEAEALRTELAGL